MKRKSLTGKTRDIYLWFEIISEWLINLSAGWFGALMVELKLVLPLDFVKFFNLTTKLLFVIVSLALAKKLRQEAGKYGRKNI